MRYLPSFRALKCFEACARTGTLSAAARELNVTPGAVSRQITALEERLGTHLMQRHHRGVTVNARGRVLATKLSAAFAAIGEAVHEVSSEPEEATLTVNVYPTFAIQWLMPRLPAFYAIAPDVDIRIRPSLQDRPLDREEIDVALSIGAPSDKSLFSRYIFERRFTPVCSPATLERTGPLEPAALEKLQIFYSDMHIQQWRMWGESVGMREPDLPEHGIRFENSSLAYQAARESFGFAIGQPTLLRNDLDTGRLIAPFPAVVRAPRPYALVCRKVDQNRPAVKRFMEWLIEEAARSVADEDQDNDTIGMSVASPKSAFW